MEEPHAVHMSIEDAVRVVAAGCGWRQPQIGAAIGKDQGTVSLMLRREGRYFGIEDLARLEDAAGKPRGFILALAGYVTVDGAKEAQRFLTREVGRK